MNEKKQSSAVEFPGNSRIHVALAATDLAASKRFYETLFGEAPTKEREGYVKFEPQDPSVNLTLNEVPSLESGDVGPAHFGIQVKSTSAVEQASERLKEAGLLDMIEENTACCYAVQDKVWAVDPNGNRWEVFVVLDPDSDIFHSDGSDCCVPETEARETVAEESGCCDTKSTACC